MVLGKFFYDNAWEGELTIICVLELISYPDLRSLCEISCVHIVGVL